MLNNAARKTRAVLVLGVATLLVSCAVSRAPEQWLDSAEEKTESGYGGWIRIWPESDPNWNLIEEGELLAVSDDSLFWFDETTVRGIPHDRIKSVKLELYKSNSGQLGVWTLLGTLSAGSHGLIAIISAPLWLLTGIGATAAATHDPNEEISETEIEIPGDLFWKNIRMGARFPAGFPEGLDRSVLKPKPESKSKSESEAK